jgi:hypothetical protein
MTNCSCPKRTENGFLVRVGRDIACAVHGDPEFVQPIAAEKPEIIQTPERAREALRDFADRAGERSDE